MPASNRSETGGYGSVAKGQPGVRFLTRPSDPLLMDALGESGCSPPGRGGRFDSRSITVLLTANQESSRGSHDLRRHFLQIVFPHEPQRYPVTEFRVQAGQPRLDYSGIFSFG